MFSQLLFPVNLTRICEWLTLTTHICFSPGRTICHCFTVLPVEGFLPATHLDLSSVVSIVAIPVQAHQGNKIPQHYWPLLSPVEQHLLFSSSEKQTRIIQAFLPCQMLLACMPGVGAVRCLLTHTPRAPAKSWHHPSAAVPGIPFTHTKKKRWSLLSLSNSWRYLKTAGWFGDGVLCHVHSWRRAAVLFFLFLLTSPRCYDLPWALCKALLLWGDHWQGFMAHGWPRFSSAIFWVSVTIGV